MSHINKAFITRSTLESIYWECDSILNTTQIYKKSMVKVTEGKVLKEFGNNLDAYSRERHDTVSVSKVA